MNVADPEIYIFSGMTPIEAEIHLKALTLFGNITRDENTTVEWRIAKNSQQQNSCPLGVYIKGIARAFN